MSVITTVRAALDRSLRFAYSNTSILLPLSMQTQIRLSPENFFTRTGILLRAPCLLSSVHTASPAGKPILMMCGELLAACTNSIC